MSFTNLPWNHTQVQFVVQVALVLMTEQNLISSSKDQRNAK